MSLLIICLTIQVPAYPQREKSDSTIRRKDSLRNLALEKQSNVLQRLKAEHEEDSIRKVPLKMS